MSKLLISGPHVHTIVCLLALPSCTLVSTSTSLLASVSKMVTLWLLVVSRMTDLHLIWGLVLPQSRLASPPHWSFLAAAGLMSWLVLTAVAITAG